MKARIEGDELTIEAENSDEQAALAKWGKDFVQDHTGSITLSFVSKIREDEVGFFYLENNLAE